MDMWLDAGEVYDIEGTCKMDNDKLRCHYCSMADQRMIERPRAMQNLHLRRRLTKLRLKNPSMLAQN